jgi:ribA/ribD-fused uncharacterized protein
MTDCRGADAAQNGGIARATAPDSPVGGEPTSPAWDHGAVDYHEDEGSPTYRMWTSEDEDGGPRGAQDGNGHPGYAHLIEGVTPASLRERWASAAANAGTRTLAFYGEKVGNPEAWLSNFYVHEPFVFALPFDAGPEFRREVSVDFAEKAIMLTKAAVMGDAPSFNAIAMATTPAAAKQSGRAITPWFDPRWQNVICGVALEVTRQKFRKVAGLGPRLLATGVDVLLVEATPHDKV